MGNIVTFKPELCGVFLELLHFFVIYENKTQFQYIFLYIPLSRVTFGYHIQLDISFWNNIVTNLVLVVVFFASILGWVLKTKTYFSRNSPVFLLGKCYHFKTDGMYLALNSFQSYSAGALWAYF